MKKKRTDKDIEIAELKGVLWSVFHSFDKSTVAEFLIEDHKSAIYDIDMMIDDELTDLSHDRPYLNEVKKAKKLHQKILRQLKSIAKDIKKVESMGYA